MQINLKLDVDIPNNTVTANDNLNYPLELVLLKGDVIYDSIRSNPDIVKEAEILKEYTENDVLFKLDGRPKPKHNFTSKGQVNIVLNVDFDNDLIRVSGDSQGIYATENEIWSDHSFADYNPIILDSIKNNLLDPVEKALFKVTEPEYYRILYSEEYVTEPEPKLQLDMSKFLQQNDL